MLGGCLGNTLMVTHVGTKGGFNMFQLHSGFKYSQVAQ